MSQHVRELRATRYLLRTLSAIALLTLSSCTPLISAEDPSYPAIDSHLTGDPNERPYWVNDDEVLYSARTDEDRINPTTAERYQAYRLVLWNVQTNKATWMQEMWGRICFKDGYVHTHMFDFRATGETPVIHTHGKIDGPLTTVTSSRSGLEFDLSTCRPRSESPKHELPEWTKGKTVRELEEIGGILVLDGENERSDRNATVTFHPGGREKGIPMPFKRREIDVRGYHPFKDAYFIVAEYFKLDARHPNGGYNVSPPPKGWVHHVWWLYRDGRIEQASLVPNERRSWASIVPYRDGYLWHGNGAIGDAIYLTDETTDKPVLPGSTWQHVTSPDGCRLAVTHARSMMDRWDTRTLKIIELCKGERK